MSQPVLMQTYLLGGHGIGLPCSDGKGEADHGLDLAQFGLVSGLDSGFHGSRLVVENAPVYGLKRRRFTLLRRFFTSIGLWYSKACLDWT